MEQNPSSEADSHSVSQGIPRLFMAAAVSLPCSQQPRNSLTRKL